MKDRAAITLLITIGSMQGVLFLCANAQCPTLSTDMAIIAGFLHNFSRNLFDGTLYPRWLGSQFNGTGAPVFVIYSPLAFFIGSCLALPAHLDPFGIYQLGLAMCLGIICSALASYFWLRRHTSAGMAALIACVLLVVPTRFLQMQIQTGLSGIWATVFFPLALYCLERWREGEDKRFLVASTVMLALILLTHTPSAMLFWPVLALYGLCYRPADIRTFVGLCIAFVLALGLSCIYLIPALLNRPDVSLINYLHFFADYDVMFLTIDSVLFYFVPKILMDALPFVMIAIISLWIARPGSKTCDLRAVTRLCGLTILATTVFFTPITKPLWEHSDLLHWLQAPFRFLALFFVLSPILLLWIGRRVRAPVFLALLCVFVLPGGWRAWGDYTVRRNVSVNAQGIEQSNLTTQAAATEYKTVWMPARLSAPGDFKTAYGSIQPAAFTEGGGTVQVRSWKDERITLHLDTSAPATLRIRQNYFPGWVARIGNESLHLHPDALGLMLVDVPTGSHDLTVGFSELKGSTLGEALSITSLLMVMAISFVDRRCSRKMD